MLCALIMAGGKGTRFWPLSTEEKPKQFLNLLGEETMLQMTINRIKPIIPIERIFICTGEKYVGLLKEQLPEILESNIIVEPEGRNTAPCIALSAFVIKRYYKDATMVVLPSDHLIKDEESFLKTIEDANEFITDYKGAIITLGMKPDRAEVGYGYIKKTNEHVKINGNDIVKVDKFVEKPDKDTAQKYLESGEYLWNGGMFIWKVENVLELIKRYQHETYEALKDIEHIDNEELNDYIKNRYSLTKEVSVDYGIMEHAADSIYVIPSDFGWDDIGTWEAIERYRNKDDLGNIHIGKTNCRKGSNNLIVSTNSEIIVDGLDDIYIIENDGKIIVGRKDNVNNVKEFIKF
ncbi:mannose-1-phosphate guanylyltransferase [Clostridium sp. YIM B02505]|uniref:Mannose-1-phosphate guanylyltransferase n=1 Tax=Clostridium yunnanense TaxID=2800325 RepID=A0ABS1EWY2_9CLOT|nr:mannose-1-phosphate guanylyltransferase [Clostridium yunnanense]MBK1813885.1 mannose-1-phosphate guanylyltransferase [Clostridium yunnanense]